MRHSKAIFLAMLRLCSLTPTPRFGRFRGFALAFSLPAPFGDAFGFVRVLLMANYKCHHHASDHLRLRAAARDPSGVLAGDFLIGIGSELQIVGN